MGEYAVLRQRVLEAPSNEDLPDSLRFLTAEVSRSLMAANDNLNAIENAQ